MYAMLVGGLHKLCWRKKCWLMRLLHSIATKPSIFTSTVLLQRSCFVVHLWWFFSIRFRNHKTWHSIDTALVRTMARNVSVGPVSSRSWIYTSLLELPNCFVQFGSESVGKCKQFNAKGANDAECNTAKIAEVVKLRDRNFEQLRYVAWWVSGGYYEVIENCWP